MDIELISFIKSSKQRVKILMAFHSSITPSEVSRTTGLSPSHVSRSLKEFSEKGIVKCSNPKSHIGKIYTLTEKGEEIKDVLEGGKVADKYSK